MSEVLLRVMNAADLDRVMDIEVASYSIPWTEGTFRSLLRRGDAELVVAESGGRVIGYAVFWFVVDQGELGNIAVADEWRSRGIGGRLVLDALRRAAQHGVRELFLEVRPSNTSARDLYVRHGFREVGRRRNYYLKPSEDALVMRCPIEGTTHDDPLLSDA